MSSQEPEAIPVRQIFPHQDKAMHAAEFAPLGWLSLKAFMPSTSAGLLASLGFSLAYAASDEVHQSFVPGREAGVMDWVADAMGILISSFVYYIKAFKHRRW